MESKYNNYNYNNIRFRYKYEYIKVDQDIIKINYEGSEDFKDEILENLITSEEIDKCKITLGNFDITNMNDGSFFQKDKPQKINELIKTIFKEISFKKLDFKEIK